MYFFENILLVFNKNLSYRMLIYNCECLVKPKKHQHVIQVSMFTSNNLNCQMRAQADRATGLKPVSKVRISADFRGPIYDQPLFEQNDRFAFRYTKQYSKYCSLNQRYVIHYLHAIWSYKHHSKLFSNYYSTNFERMSIRKNETLTG